MYIRLAEIRGNLLEVSYDTLDSLGIKPKSKVLLECKCRTTGLSSRVGMRGIECAVMASVLASICRREGLDLLLYRGKHLVGEIFLDMHEDDDAETLYIDLR